MKTAVTGCDGRLSSASRRVGATDGNPLHTGLETQGSDAPFLLGASARVLFRRRRAERDHRPKGEGSAATVTRIMVGPMTRVLAISMRSSQTQRSARAKATK